jgi:type I restriction enzyme R subunit
MHTDTSERGLERLICIAVTGHSCDPQPPGEARERPAIYGAGWVGGRPEDYDREYCADLAQLRTFLRATQPRVAEA